MHRSLIRNIGRRARAWRLGAVGATVAAAVAMSGCSVDRMLNVKDVDVATPGSLDNASGLSVLYGGGISDFQQALTGVDASITLPGLLTDELRDIDTFPTRIEIDQRNIELTNSTVQAWYRQMHRSRASLERATVAFAKYDTTPGGKAKNAEMHALEGMQFIQFAEDFCNGVAYSTFNGTPEYGGPNSGMASLRLAVAQFDSALALTTKANIHYLAEVGKARALMDLNQYDQAAAAVADVPTTFQYDIFNTTNSSNEQSGVYINVGPPSKRYAVANNDGGNGLFFRSEGQDSSSADVTSGRDTRVRWYLNGIGQDQKSPAYYQLKYPDYTSTVVVADGIEAKLIIAEDSLKHGSPAWLTTLNALRANTTLLNMVPYTNAGQSPATALPPLVDPGTDSARVDLLFHERAFWMYLTGHRLGDMRRLVWQYNRNSETVFPTGAYQGAAGGQIGPDVNFPITVDEQNNPKAQTCTDRSANFGQ